MLDIAGGTTGAWSAATVIDGAVATTLGTSGCYSPFDNEGRMFYMNIFVGSALNQIFRFDVKNRVLSPYTPTDILQGNTAVAGNRMAAYCAVDGAQNYDVIMLQANGSTICQELIPLV